MNDIEFVREQYFQNLLFTIGEWVEDVKNGYKGEVVKRGTNYVTIVQEDFSLHKVWLEDGNRLKVRVINSQMLFILLRIETFGKSIEEKL